MTGPGKLWRHTDGNVFVDIGLGQFEGFVQQTMRRDSSRSNWLGRFQKVPRLPLMLLPCDAQGRCLIPRDRGVVLEPEGQEEMLYSELGGETHQQPGNWEKRGKILALIDFTRFRNSVT